MRKNADIHYLEIVSTDVDQLCAAYSQTLGVTFGEEVDELGGAKTATISTGGMLGIRPPMHDAEEATTRPYYLVEDIEDAVREAANSGAEIAVPPLEIPGRGKCAIVMYGAIQNGFWQV